MNIENAVKNLKWRVSNTWDGSRGDLNSLSDNAKRLMEREFDSIDEIIKYVNSKEKEQFENHELFSKLYLHVFYEFNNKYHNGMKELHSLLSQPLNVHIQNLTRKLNDCEVVNLFDELNLSKGHPATIPQKLKDKETSILQQAVKDDKRNLDRLFLNVWKPEEVREVLENQINNFLNIFNHD